ncbi:unnamed protein product [Orchesella dallaii]|uniref:CUB domain-containing protein n=1 Tax=Orchesella dallaii TaxID=48710 RepID=A0ABP1S0R2_9HEXA
MKFLTAICIVLTLCQIGSASFIKSPSEQFESENVRRFNSPLKPSAPTPTIIKSNSSVLNTCSGVLNTTTGGSTGFVLEYSELRPGTNSPLSVDYIVDAGNGGFIRHPSEASHYATSELSTFMFLPSDNDQSTDRSINVMYFRGSLDNYNCYDHLRVLRFNRSSAVPTKWQDEGLICADTVSDLFTSPDLLLITFDTDTLVTGTGFQFAFTESSTNQCSN